MRAAKKLCSDALWEYAVRKLSGRAHATGELRVALAARAAESADVDRILSRLKDYGYLNDNKFAESFATARLENEGFGKSRVLRDLRSRRVAPELAEKTIAKVYADQDEPELIEQYVRRKYRSADREGLFREDKEIASAYRRLIRAGFSSANSIKVLKRFAANPDLLDSFEDAAPEDQE
jgi:regulatory protein